MYGSHITCVALASLAADLITGLATMALAVIAVLAIFQQIIVRWVLHPELKVSIKYGFPYCLDIPISYKESATGSDQEIRVDSYYIRIRVENTGREYAHEAEVFATKLEKQEDGTFVTEPSFVPMNLKWADFDDITVPSINPDTHRYCTIARVLDPKTRSAVPSENKTWPDVQQTDTILSFYTMVITHSRNHLVPPGTYRLHLLVGARNANPKRCILELTLTGQWFSELPQMFPDGLSFRIMPTNSARTQRPVLAPQTRTPRPQSTQGTHLKDS